MRGNANSTRPAAGSGKVRIIAGTLRNSRIEVADAPGLRPTPERVRETLFNWLIPVLPGARCLDLYAGTGVLGLEAASRGAGAVLLVERDRNLARAIEANVARLKVAGARVINADAAEVLVGAPSPHDIVFVDPPFAAAAWEPAFARLDAGWLAANAHVYVESPRGAVPRVPEGWLLHRESTAGDVRFALYRVPGRSVKLAPTFSGA